MIWILGLTQVAMQWSTSTNWGRCAWLAFSHLTQAAEELSGVEPFPVTPPPALSVRSHGSAFCDFRSRWGGQSSLALQPFSRPHINHAVERPHYHPWKFCRCKVKLLRPAVRRRPLCVLLSCLSRGCHSSSVLPLAVSLLGFHFRSTSLCAQPAYSIRARANRPQGGGLDPATDLAGHDLAAQPLLLNWECGIYVQRGFLPFLSTPDAFFGLFKTQIANLQQF